MTLHERLARWLAEQGREPFDFQRATWAAYAEGRSGLVHAPTGMGKTLAAWLGPVSEGLAAPSPDTTDKPEPHRVLWVTPLRALARDITAALAEPIEALGMNWSVELRTGDVSSSIRQRQRRRLPTALVTTPESLTLLLSYADAAEKFRGLRCIVVDEWHELMSTKRGVQMELALARLRTICPALRVWGLSATLGNMPQARAALLGSNTPQRERGVLVESTHRKPIDVVTLLPETIERFPWSGHLGTRVTRQVIEQIERANSTLMFTNTRSQAELWFAALLRERPDWVGQVAIHHGSLERKLRQRVEALTNAGELKAVVCTSSLDLGVDFSPVDQVMQVGSPKGIARVMQRAGRSGHQPGRVSRIVCVPTHAFELVEFAAARRAIDERRIEPRPAITQAMDVLVQHLVTCALGGGFEVDAIKSELRTTHAYANLTDQQFDWALRFVVNGGETLGAYSQYHKVVERDGRYGVSSQKIARLHRLGIGTIAGDTAMAVRYRNGKSLGTIEESFIARMRIGDKFIFAGRKLELAQVRGTTATVKPTKARPRTVPRWGGTRFPLSTQLAEAVCERLAEAAAGRFDTDEMRCVEPLLELQAAWSAIPLPGVLLVELTTSRDGHHAMVYPFGGRLVHEGLGALLAYRLSQREPRLVTVTANDYGIELLSPDAMPLSTEAAWRELLGPERLAEDLLACLNATQLARRYFRDIARIAGLIFTGYPGQGKATRHLQASSDLFFDVFEEFDPGNLLLDQARREVLEQQLEVKRLRELIEAMDARTIDVRHTQRLSPLAFPLWADRLRSQHVSSEKWQDRIDRMVARLESEADGALRATSGD